MHRRQGRRPLQTSGARADGTASGHHPGTDDPGAGPIPAGMGRLFRLQPVARVGLARRLDQTAAAMRRLGPVEDARQAIPGTSPPQGLRTAGQCGYLQPEGNTSGVRSSFWSTIPRIKEQTGRFRLLTLIVVVGGLARLLGLLLSGVPSLTMLGGLAMELVVTPLLCLWQTRVANRYAERSGVADLNRDQP